MEAGLVLTILFIFIAGIPVVALALANIIKVSSLVLPIVKTFLTVIYIRYVLFHSQTVSELRARQVCALFVLQVVNIFFRLP